MKMKDLPLSERPYEKLELYGAVALSNAELLAIIIKSGIKDESSVSIAQKILSVKNKKEDSLSFLNEMSIEELTKIRGIVKVKAIQLKAACEFSKRINRPIDEIKIQIKSPKDIVKFLYDEYRFEKKEIVKVIILNSKSIVLKTVDICLGNDNSAILKPRDVFIEAIKMSAPRVIVVHNHPSGDPSPSKSDLNFTNEIIKASKILGIELLDHIIIGDNRFESIFTYIRKIEE